MSEPTVKSTANEATHSLPGESTGENHPIRKSAPANVSAFARRKARLAARRRAARNRGTPFRKAA